MKKITLVPSLSIIVASYLWAIVVFINQKDLPTMGCYGSSCFPAHTPSWLVGIIIILAGTLAAGIIILISSKQEK